MMTDTEAPVVEVIGLSVSVGEKPILSDISLSVWPGEVVGIVGESGSGKTTLGLAVLGHFRSGLYPVSGEVRVGQYQVLDLNPPSLRAYREKITAYIPQNPGTALNPALRIGTLIAEALPPNLQSGPSKSLSLLREVGLPANEAFLRLYPHQLSGGQQQRVAIASAFAREPQLILLDEPTTALDVTTQSQILETLQRLCRDHGAAALYVSHDLAVVGTLARRVVVMFNGRVIETGETGALFRSPRSRYTRSLIAAIPNPAAASRTAGLDEQTPALAQSTRGLKADRLEAMYGNTPVLRDVSVHLQPKACVALVGQSGSGKTTLARCLVGLHRPSAGALTYHGTPLAASTDKRTTDQRRRIQYVFQNPFSAFNPRRSIGASIAAALLQFERLPRQTLRARVAEVLDQVALQASVAGRLPSQLSGGQRQRAAIARALILEPDVLICDEITSALDVTVQATIIDLLQQLQSQRALSLLFVTHNLALVRQFAQQVVVMHQGRIVEQGNVEGIFTHPQAKETRSLLEDIPHLPFTEVTLTGTRSRRRS
jgi:peptide/nickel transport system ATP-binding protein